MIKGGKRLFEHLLFPLFYLYESHGVKLLITCFFCIVIISEWEKQIELPRQAHDTVGDIPIIENFDDGKTEIKEDENYVEKVGHTYSTPMVTGYFRSTPMRAIVRCDTFTYR